MDSPKARPSSFIIHRSCFVLWLLVLGLLAFSSAVDQGLNHDEHQFAAPAILWERDGLLPYRDYAFFHMPYTVFLYGVVASLSEYKFLSMRLLCGFFSWITLAGLAYAGWRFLREKGNALRWAGTIGAPLLLLCSASYLSTSGRIWNHDVPVACIVVGTLLLLRSVRGKNMAICLFAAGCLAGVATGLRLTFAPLAAPFCLAPFLLFHLPVARRFLLCVFAAAGFATALAPAGALALKAPEAFLFGNFQYPRLPKLDVNNTRIQKTVTPWRKGRYFFKEVVRSNAPIFIPWFLALGLLIYRKSKNGRPIPTEAILLLLVTFFLLMGCFAPSRYQYQHFYQAMPLYLLLVLTTMPVMPRWQLAVLGCCVALAPFEGKWNSKNARLTAVTSYAISLDSLFNLRKSTPLDVHKKSLGILSRAEKGPILTLAPLMVLEGGGQIYKEFALGPFGWRNAHLLESKRRKTQQLVAPEDLEAFLADHPPAAVLLGFEVEPLEKPFRDYAEKQGWPKLLKQENATLFGTKPASQ